MNGSRRSILKGAAVLGGLATAPLLARAAPKRGAGLDPLLAMPGHELAAAIARREVSSVEAMTVVLGQIDRLNPTVNAVVALGDRGDLLCQARAMDARIAAGDAPGPLAGMPWAVKDLLDVRGIRSTKGSLAFKDDVPGTDSPMAARLREAGAIFIGKTNAPEFGMGSHTYNRVYGATHNAYDPSRSAGGSSGGAAVSVALRMLPMADGSDFGGSLRNPAVWNNVFGLRPGIAPVPDAGRGEWISMGVLGPMGRTVRDLAFLHMIQTAPQGSPLLSDPAAPARYLDALDVDPRGKRIAWLGDWGRQVPTDPAVLEICKSSLKAFADMGCTVEEVRPALDVEPVWQAMKTLRSALYSNRFRSLTDDPARAGQFGPQVLWEVENGRNFTAEDVRNASNVGAAFTREFERMSEAFDFVVAPAVQVFPFPVEDLWPREVAGHTMRSYHEWMLCCFLITMTGLPALAAPAGFSAQGWPVGIQIVGKRGGDLACLQMAHAYEQARRDVIGRLSPLLA